VVALDNSTMRDENIDTVVNLLNHNPSLTSPASPRVSYYEGVEYAILRPDFAAFAGAKRSIRRTVRDVLISFGGGDPCGHTLRVLRALVARCDPKAVLHVVLGASFRGADEVEAIAAKARVHIEVLQRVREMAALMARCDIGFTGGGTTMMEMAAVGTPNIVLPQTARESKFAAVFEARGAVLRLRKREVTSADAVVRAFERVGLDADCRRRMSRAGRNMIDGRGRDRTADLILAEFRRHRGRDG
jgi:spore coat polysaccharide biosynthesis predicted glycosyltransferase SpsG